MNLSEIVESKGYKAFMAKLYGIGAAVVITGALFKIMHWPYASEMLIAGLGTEALIFFASAFEPPHETVDWSLVYPELAGLSDDDQDALAEDPKLAQKKSALEKFDEMINEAQISPELFRKLGAGLHNLNETTSKLSDLSDASLVTNDYVSNVKKASDSMTQFSTSYGNSIDSLNQSAGTLSESYIQTSEVIKTSGQSFAQNVSSSSTAISTAIINSAEEFSSTFKESYIQSTETIKSSSQSFAEKIASGGIELNDAVKRSGLELAETYEKLTASMNDEFNKSNEGNKTYTDQLDIMGKNLTALNAVYEIQLQNSSEHIDASKELYSGLHEMMSSFKESANDAKVYREEVSKLGKNLMALNTIYGNMLSAMTITKSND